MDLKKRLWYVLNTLRTQLMKTITKGDKLLLLSSPLVYVYLQYKVLLNDSGSCLKKQNKSNSVTSSSGYDFLLSVDGTKPKENQV